MIPLFIKKQGLALVALVLALPLSAAAGELYKWTDAAGVVQYTQHPPKDRPYETINVSGTKSPAAAASKPDSETPEAENAGADTETEGKQAEKTGNEAKDFLAAKKKNCEIARTNENILKNKARIAVRDAKGEQRILSDDEKAAQLKLVEEQIRTYCN